MAKAVLYCWYDNEFGYSCQVVRCLEKFAGVVWPSYPRQSLLDENQIEEGSAKEDTETEALLNQV